MDEHQSIMTIIIGQTTTTTTTTTTTSLSRGTKEETKKNIEQPTHPS
jgi:hypothetical protein